MGPCCPDDARQNRLIAALPAIVQAKLASHLVPVAFAAGELIFDAGEPIESVYFPTSAVVSFTHVVDDHPMASVGLAGAEGLVGVERLLGGESSIGQALVQLAGWAFKIDAAVLIEEFEQGRSMQWLLLRYVHALMSQISHSAVCERLHSIEQRLVRWLLLTDDRRATGELAMTQESLSHLLGVRREGVAIAAKHLQTAGLIDYRRGRMILVDRARLEAGACSCYRDIRAEYDRLLRETA